MSKLVMLPILALASLGGAVGGYQYRTFLTPDMPDGQALRLPVELKVKSGRSEALVADCVGRRVRFASADLETRPRDEKSCWVFGYKPGRYQVIAWSAVGEYPTEAVTCTVVVEGDEPPAQKGEDKQASMEARR